MTWSSTWKPVRNTHTQTGLLLSYRKSETLPFVAMLNSMLNEIGQKNRDKYQLYVKSKKIILMNVYTKQTDSQA